MRFQISHQRGDSTRKKQPMGGCRVHLDTTSKALERPRKADREPSPARSAFVASRSLKGHRPAPHVRGCCEPGRLAVRWQSIREMPRKFAVTFCRRDHSLSQDLYDSEPTFLGGVFES